MDFNTLNKEQLQAATFEGKHLLVLAGAGTGKTRTIIARALYLIKKGINPSRIKILSFTKKSANEIASRIKIEGKNTPETKRISGSTFHSWCMDIITKYGKLFGLEEYSCIDEEDRLSAIKIAYGKVYDKNQQKLNNIIIKPKEILEVYSYSINTQQNLSTSIKVKCLENTSDTDYLTKKTEEIKEIAIPVIKEYIDYKKSRHYIDYDDMLKIVATILKQNEKLRDLISSQYDHILIDEMQDTNPLQWMLIESFIDNCHLFCVGDDAQSIYSFRGADFKSIHSFKNKIPNSVIYKLEENYRSTQGILDLSNWLLRKSKLDYNKQLRSNRGFGEKPFIKLAEDDWDEADFIINDIKNNIHNGENYRAHMILTRSMYGCRTFEAACISCDIPYILFGGISLMKSAHVRDVFSVLRIVHNHKDELAWMRYLMLWEGIGEATASKLIERTLDCKNLHNCIDVIKQKGFKDSNIYTLLEKVISLNDNVDTIIDLIVSELEIIMQKKYENWDRRKNDFNALKLVAKRSTDIQEFITKYILDPIAELSELETSTLSNDVVTISTIHSAKGLEAKYCYILGVYPGNYPSNRAITDDDIEEERRCLYVALTRAKDKLFLMSRIQSNYGIRKNNANLTENQSYFLNALPENLVTIIDNLNIDSNHDFNDDDYNINIDPFNDFDFS